MSPLPAMDSVGADLYDRLAPLAALDDANLFAFAHLCQAIGLMRQQVADLSEDRDGSEGWTRLVDVETAPADTFDWLAQVPGTTLTKGAPEDFRRDELRRHAGQARCRPASMREAVQATLLEGSSKTVRIIERTTSAWTLTIITRTAETVDVPATLAAIESQMVGGDVYTHVISDAPIVDEISLDIDSLTEDIDDLTLGGVT